MLDITDKRKRDEGDEGDQDQRGEDIMEIMEVMCEDDVEDYKDAEMEEEIGDDYGGRHDQAWADMEDDINHQEEEVYDDLTGKLLKYEKVVEARIDEIKALVKMGVWETVPLAKSLSRTQRRPIMAAARATTRHKCIVQGTSRGKSVGNTEVPTERGCSQPCHLWRP